MYLVDWKGFLPAGEVHVPRRVEGKPSTRRGTCLAGWKETFPAGEDVPRRLEEPRRLEGNPSSRPLAPGIPWDTRISARFGGGKRPSAAESAPPGGYPLGPAGICQRITDIRSGLSATISNRREGEERAARKEELRQDALTQAKHEREAHLQQILLDQEIAEGKERQREADRKQEREEAIECRAEENRQYEANQERQEKLCQTYEAAVLAVMGKMSSNSK
ncbi:hypothetical protein PGTUg99_016117 [Puccinia graminis f. sp. tritici]|uniref:Uncharacterized protein n=1 Tax=Puccinia graminis f. sp. tritici TaxID=56615 RepID=A0A5B0RGN7_PUCGR|nr:hypothetical protein PGTUg99_016117 [Puccinia graminis f. sp. tritici]